VKEWTGGSDIRLGLNCVSGPATTAMAGLLGQNSHFVSYGAMSKQPLCLPTSLFIFKNLQCHGFWQSRWYKERDLSDRKNLMNDLAALMDQKILKEPEHEIVKIASSISDEAATKEIRDVMARIANGKYGKKVLLHLESEQ